MEQDLLAGCRPLHVVADRSRTSGARPSSARPPASTPTTRPGSRACSSGATACTSRQRVRDHPRLERPRAAADDRLDVVPRQRLPGTTSTSSPRARTSARASYGLYIGPTAACVLRRRRRRRLHGPGDAGQRVGRQVAQRVGHVRRHDRPPLHRRQGDRHAARRAREPIGYGTPSGNTTLGAYVGTCDLTSPATSTRCRSGRRRCRSRRSGRSAAVLLRAALSRDKLRSPRGCSSAGRASGWQPEGQGFEPPQLHLSRPSERAASVV